MVKSGAERLTLLARGGGVLESRVSPLKSGLRGFLDALFFMVIALAFHSEVLKFQTHPYFSALKFILARVYKKEMEKTSCQKWLRVSNSVMSTESSSMIIAASLSPVTNFCD
jgi:hypothetical protein